ncbi:hypothetical protein AB6A40_008142 [Gnathostoma spinigerum]|uniref:Uncharacterized protein n=1 Tax=Gnathostoma spinigerum TaxID=75299 RepID=A0ABD6EWJ3_9BILA
MGEVVLRQCESQLNVLIDEIAEDSSELLIERPRFAHGIVVLANYRRPGELITVAVLLNTCSIGLQLLFNL